MRILFKTNYKQDLNLAKHGGHRFWYGLLILVLFAAPLILGGYYIGEATRILIYAMAGLGLMVLTGFTGQVSLGHAAFLAIGAYTNAWFLAQGFSSFVALPMAALLSMIGGLLVAIPAARMSGIYLAIATLAFAIIVEDFAGHLNSITGGNRGMMVDVPTMFGYQIWESWELYLFVLSILVAATLAVLNILRSPLGRAMIAVRDSEVSSQALGVNPMKIKVFAFTVSAAITGLAGAFLAHYMSFLTPQIFGILLSIQLLLMIVLGGLGTVHGVFFGAVLIGVLETGISIAKDTLPSSIGGLPGIEPFVFGAILISVIVFEPTGIYGRWIKIRSYMEFFPIYRRKSFKRQRAYLKTERLR